MRWFVRSVSAWCLSANREVIAIDRMYVCICCFANQCDTGFIRVARVSCFFFFLFFHFSHPIRLARIVIIHVSIPYKQDISTMIYFMILSLHYRTEELRIRVRLFDIIRLPCLLSFIACSTTNKSNGFARAKLWNTQKIEPLSSIFVVVPFPQWIVSVSVMESLKLQEKCKIGI